MNVFLQSLLLGGIGICVWLAFHPSSREDYDDIETPRRPPRPSVVFGAPDIPPPITGPQHGGDGRLIGQYRGDHDDAQRAAGAGHPDPIP